MAAWRRQRDEQGVTAVTWFPHLPILRWRFEERHEDRRADHGDFMKRPRWAGKDPTAMFDGSFMYNFGDSTYEGRFLGISYETMLAAGRSGHGSFRQHCRVEYYGTNGLGNEGKNGYSVTEGLSISAPSTFSACLTA